MSQPQTAKPAKLVMSVLVNEKALMPEVAADLESVIGKIDAVSAWMDFNFTAYYQDEMGTPLFRRMMAFKNLIEQPTLVDVKLATNKVEQSYSKGGDRCVNIDPGYLLLERFVLATGKNYSHRIYLDRGIYADLTLVYQKGAYQALPWTYPDYKDSKMLQFLHQVRVKYAADLRLMPSTAKVLEF